jgi:diguanylate cyclase (GGDEF)-like protein
MSLSRKLGVGFFCVFLLMLIATLWSNTNNTRKLITLQMNSHTQEAASSLGALITPYLDDIQDLVTAEAMTTAIFNSGNYSSIELSDLNNNVIIKHSKANNVKNIPEWFFTLFHIDESNAVTKIKHVGIIKGRLVVKSNTGFAYQQLWTNTLNNMWITSALFAAVLMFLWLLVTRIIAAPIRAVIEQTQSISHHQFTQITEIPKSKELRKFVEAFNLMSKRLATVFTQLTDQSEKYRLFAYADPLTKVGNRRAFELYIEQLLSNEAKQTSGHLVIIRASSLAEVHKRYGGNIGDNYLIELCATIDEILSQGFEHYSIYRINGADFGILLENSKTTQIVSLAKTLTDTFKRIEKSEYTQGTAHIGIASFTFNDSISTLIERTDNALGVAIDNSKRWELSDNLSVSYSNEVWRDKLVSVLEIGTSDFAAQAIMNTEQIVEYSEWFARLPNEECSISMPMTQLIPASIRVDHAQKLDQLIVSNLLDQLKYSNTKVGVNLSRLSIFDAEFMDWFIDKLNQYGDQCKNLIVEISERALVNDIELLQRQTDRLKSIGVKITVEHFGAQLAGIGHLSQLAPDYLKIDGRFTKNIHSEIDKQLFIGSLINIAHGLNIKVIAEMVETEAEKNWLMAAQVDFFQGYFIAPPHPVGD